ncbi:MAG: Ig-like domain-containing protein, partial [Thermodesulfobacteriota bacterium]
MIYQENQPIININDPIILATSLEVYLISGQQNTFTITAYDNLGNESLPSPPFIVDVPAEDVSGNIPPVASIEISTLSGPAPLTVDVSATTSVDYDGTIISFAWNFGDGGGSSYENDSHTFDTPGTYIVILEVTDDAGSLATAGTTVTVTDPQAIPNQPPTPLIYTTTNSGPAPLDVLFDGTDSTDSDGTIIDYSWDFGDGSSARGIFVNYTYPAVGTFTGQLTVSDDAGASASEQTVISVVASTPLNNPPLAVINASPLTGSAPLTPTFSGADSTDSDGVIKTYDWDFGDGSTARGVDVSHQYLTAGTYTATLNVTDDMGDTGQAQIIISVSEETPTSTVIYSDDFTADTSSSYTNINGKLSVLNGTAHGSDWQITFAHHNLSLGTSDHWVEADVTYNGLSSSAGLIARVNTANNTGYAAYFSAGKINLNRFAGTSQSWLASVAGAYGDGTYTLRMVVTGSTIQVYVDGVLKIQKTDITYPDGLHAGFRIHRGSDNADVTADNLKAGIGSPPPFPKQNTPPVAQNTSFTTQEDSTAKGTFVVSDLDGDPLTTSIVTNGTLGNATITNSLTGTYSYTPDPDVSGTDSFTYKANDGTADSNVSTITITITPLNDQPLAANDTVSTIENNAVIISVLANDRDIDADKLTINATTMGANGSVTNNTISLTYTPNANWYGTDTFSYTISDGNGGMDTATVTVNVSPVNDPPVAQDSSLTTTENTPTSAALMAADIEGDPLTYAIVANGTLGTAVISDPASGAFTYTPRAGTSGTDSFTFKANDGTADSNVGTITVTINKVVSTYGINDDFSTDSSSSYTVISGAMTVSDGKAHGQQWADTRVLHNRAIDSDDQFVEADVYYSGATQGAGLLIRLEPTLGTGYLAYF